MKSKFCLVSLLFLSSVLLRGAVPALTDFNANQFSTAGGKVAVKSAALLTNTSFIGNLTLNGNAFTNGTGVAGVSSTFLFEVTDLAGGTSVDPSMGSWFSKTLTGDTTFTFANLADGQQWNIIVTNGASWTITWPSITWISGSTPVMDVGAGVVNLFSFKQSGGVVFGDYSQTLDPTIVRTSNIDTSAELAAIVTDETGSGLLVFNTNAVLVTPTIVSFANAIHTHANAAGGGTLTEVALAGFTDITTANASITQHGLLRRLDNNSAHYLDGQGGWTTPAGGGGSGTAVLSSLGITIDGGGAAITTGTKGYFYVPADCTIQNVTMLADQVGGCAVDIYKTNYTTYPPTSASPITGASVPTITATNKMTDSTLTGWQLTLSAGDVVAFNVNSNATIQRLTVTLKVQSTMSSIGITIDSTGSPITAGVKGYIYVPFACTISSVTMLADRTGAAIVDIWKDTYANYPPDVADTITAGTPPTITGNVKSQDTTLSGWNTSVAAGDVLGFNVNSATSIQRLNLILKVTK